MGVRRISGKGAGVGFGVGCGFGIGALSHFCNFLSSLLQSIFIPPSHHSSSPLLFLLSLPFSCNLLTPFALCILIIHIHILIIFAGWGFGGAPIGILGMGIGGGCGLGVALGWGVGVGYGTQYINMSPEFSESKTHRPNVFQHVQYAFKRLTTLTGTPPPKQAQQS